MAEKEWDTMLIERHGVSVVERLKQAEVAIAGLGGLGSHVAMMLARTGVGRLHLLDFDKVEASNLNRQIYKMKDIGRYKTTALKEELKEINPYIQVRTDTVKLNAENTAEYFKDAAIVCEALDQAVGKAMLINTLMQTCPAVRIVAASGLAGYEDSNQIKTVQRMKNLWMCGDGINGIETKGTLMAPRVMICAGHQANMIIRLILGTEEM